MTQDDPLLSRLSRDLDPPADLEDRVVTALDERRLLGGHRRHGSTRRLALAAAASVAILAIGVVLGRATAPSTAPAGTLTGAETDVYALLLYENADYVPPTGAEAGTRYREYSLWVAEAYKREQFITGEDLEAERGWLLSPSGDGPRIESAATVEEAAPLSGIFFIRADGPEHALALARELPHLSHGGKVVVQKTVPTVTPPDA